MTQTPEQPAPALADEPAEFGTWLRLINHGD